MFSNEIFSSDVTRENNKIVDNTGLAGGAGLDLTSN